MRKSPMASSQDELTQNKSWLTKISSALKREPQDKDELLFVLKDAASRDLIDIDTLSMIESVILLSELKAKDIMVPKQQMVAITPDTEFDKIQALVSEHGHSRYPIINENKDDVLGILHAKDLLTTNPEEKNFALRDLIRPATIIPESKKLNILLTEFRHNRTHMAIVVDEYGIISGLVTIEDILEQIVGEIEDEFDPDDDLFIKEHDNDKYIIKAHIAISDFNEYFSLNLSEDLSESLGGLITKTLGHLPKTGETVIIDDIKFSVLSADNRRVKLIELIRSMERD